MTRSFQTFLESRSWAFELLVLGLRISHRTLSTLVPYRPPVRRIEADRLKALVPSEVRPSTIPAAGLGLFALEPVGPGVTIGEYLGDLILSFGKVLRVRDFRYLAMWEQLDGAIDAAAHPEMMMRYVNHHPDQGKVNVRFRADGHRVFLETTATVGAGAEFFAHYSELYWRLLKQAPAAP